MPSKRVDSDHSTHAQILMRVFALHWYNLTCQMILLADSEGLIRLRGCADSEEANWSRSALFVIKYVKFLSKPGSSNLIDWILEVGGASYLFSMTRVNMAPTTTADDKWVIFSPLYPRQMERNSVPYLSKVFGRTGLFKPCMPNKGRRRTRRLTRALVVNHSTVLKPHEVVKWIYRYSRTSMVSS